MVGVFASLCAASHKPRGNHRAHTTPIPHFTRGQENSQHSRARTERMEEWKREATAGFTWQTAARCQQQMDSDGFSTWISLLAGNPSLLLSVDTKSMGERNHRKTINQNQAMCSTHQTEHYSLTMLCPSLRGTPNKRQTNTSPNIYRDTLLCRGMR